MNRGTHLAIGDTGRAEDRVVRIVNLHYDAESNDIHKFFGNDFTIVDLIRGVNPKTNKNTVGYVLFSTEQDRINAQFLSGRQLLDREVKILPAQGGFRVSSSGDELLPPAQGKSAASSEAPETDDAILPAIGDVVAFPLLSRAATLRPGAGALVANTPTRKQSAQQRARQNCLLFMNNVGQGAEVNETSFRLFFGQYTVVDVKRFIDPRTNSPHPTAFVMLASSEQRDEALHLLKDVSMQGRKLTLEVPKTFQSVDEHGFIPSPGENVITFSAHPRGIAANNTPRATASTNMFVHEGLQLASQLKVFETPPIPATGDDIEFHGQLGMTDNGTQQQAPPQRRTQRQKEAETVRKAEDERQAKKTMWNWGLSREELSKRYIGQKRSLLPMPSGVEGPGQVFTGPPMTPPVGYSSPFSRPLGSGSSGPSPNIDTSFRPREYNWNLSGDQDPAPQITSEEAWYGGLQALQRRQDR